MRILFLSRWLPFPADNGAKLRIFNLVRLLADHHQVELLSFADETHSGMAAAAGACPIPGVNLTILPYRPFRSTSARALRGFLSSMPRFLVDTYSPAMAAAITATAQRCQPDLVIASQLDLLPYAHLAGCPVVLEELEVAIHYDACRAHRSVGRRLRARLTWHKLGHYLRRELARVAACTVVSRREETLVRLIAPARTRIEILPNAVELPRYQGDFGAPVPNTMVHTGALSYRPNRDAVDFFLANILPAVQNRVRGVQLRVTGALPADLAERGAAPGVEFTGYVDDIRPIIAQGWLAVVPLRIGGGTRLKILEAMALGTPVVSTTKGAEGLNLVADDEILIADEPDNFARAVIDLLGSPARRAHLAVAGQRRIAESYSWQRVGQPFLELIDTIGREPQRYRSPQPFLNRA